MKRKPEKTPYKEKQWRLYLLISILLLICLGLFFRMLTLSIFDRDFLVKQNKARVLRTIKTPAHRGIILDRNGHPLAVSTSVVSVWINPKIIKISPKEIKTLSELINLPEAKINQHLAQSKREFVYLKRALSPDIAEQIKALKIPGLFFQYDYKRYYPDGESFAHVLGFTNIDDKGQEGLEFVYNDWLTGKPGKRNVLKDRVGHIVAEVSGISEPEEGHALKLSLDSRLQYLAYNSLITGLKNHRAKSASVVVLNPKTGEVLAMINYPSYNPNHRPAKHDDRYRNRAVTDTFEPGSTMKAFSVAAALASKKYTPESTINTDNGQIKVGRKVIRDLGHYGIITVREAVKKSSEVAIIKMALSIPPESLWNFLKSVGFGEQTESGFLGEATGSLPLHRRWRPIEVATLSYGYGVSVTALQLARAYATIANDGIKNPISFLKLNEKPVGEQAIPKSLANTVLHLLEAVVEKGGTGERAKISGYHVAGKTGTAYTASKHGGYDEKRYTASFIGIAPVSNPQLVVAVVVHDVTGEAHFGAQVAAPVFANIMQGSLRILNIPPDALDDELLLKSQALN